MKATSFLQWLEAWERARPTYALRDTVGRADETAIVAVDLVKGFCTSGALASPRIAAIVPLAIDLFQRAYALGVRHFLLLQDAHSADAVEFAAFPPHCQAGSEESETVEALTTLPFADHFTYIPKNSISPNLGTALPAWLEAHPEVRRFIVIGDCTDLCVAQAALYLRLRANALDLHAVRIIVPADAVQTYDLPVEQALAIGALPHDGDLLHRLFLYHLALNGIEVVAHLE